MAIEDTKQLYSTWYEESANEYLALGWKLIAVATEQTGAETVSVNYKLAWQADGEPAKPVSRLSTPPDLSVGEF